MSAFTVSRSTPLPAGDAEIAEIGLIGIGNTLMGDDGAGIIAVEKVRLRKPDPKKAFIYALQRDLFEMADLLDRARRFIFVDVYLGSPAGTIALFSDQSAKLMPSIHQADIGTIMRMLKPLGLVVPFPPWEIRGIAVEPPFLLGKGLSRPVSSAVDRIVPDLCKSAGL